MLPFLCGITTLNLHGLANFTATAPTEEAYPLLQMSNGRAGPVAAAIPDHLIITILVVILALAFFRHVSILSIRY